MLKSRFYKICVIFLIFFILFIFILFFSFVVVCFASESMHTLDMLRYYNIYNDYVYNNWYACVYAGLQNVRSSSSYRSSLSSSLFLHIKSTNYLFHNQFLVIDANVFFFSRFERVQFFCFFFFDFRFNRNVNRSIFVYRLLQISTRLHALICCLEKTSNKKQKEITKTFYNDCISQQRRRHSTTHNRWVHRFA